LRRTARKTWHYFETFVTAERTGCLPTISRKSHAADRFADVAHEYRLALLANSGARDLGLPIGGALIGARQDTSAPCSDWSGIADTSTIGMIPARSNHSSRAIYRVWTAATWRALLTHSSGLRELPDEKIFSPQIFAGFARHGEDTQGFFPRNALLATLDADLEKAPARLSAAFTLLETAKSKRPRSWRAGERKAKK